ncbi:MAG: hypothetical protein JNK92_10690 [Dechloromonas sp.]|nr:hypothetical protein [Dechloromonas sp.]
MSTPILARADKLMRRRRSRSADLDDVPVLVDAIDPETDIPLLVDAEPATMAPEPHTKMESATAPAFFPVLDQAMLDLIVNELARRVQDRFAAELPAIIEGTVRDFLAEPDTLALIQPRD